jgi:hypothetical protein
MNTADQLIDGIRQMEIYHQKTVLELAEMEGKYLRIVSQVEASIQRSISMLDGIKYNQPCYFQEIDHLVINLRELMDIIPIRNIDRILSIGRNRSPVMDRMRKHGLLQKLFDQDKSLHGDEPNFSERWKDIPLSF